MNLTQNTHSNNNSTINNTNIHSIHSEKSKSTIKNIIFNNNGNQFVFCNRDSSILNVYDLLTFKQIKQIDIKTQINDFKFDKTDSFLFIADDNGIIHKINAKDFDEKKKIDGHFFSINCLEISNSNKFLISGGIDSLIVQYDLNEDLSTGILKRGDQSVKEIILIFLVRNCNFRFIRFSLIAMNMRLSGIRRKIFLRILEMIKIEMEMKEMFI